MTRTETAALRNHLDELADDVGRLRRRFASNEEAWTGTYITDRIASHIQTLHSLLEPTAFDLATTTAPCDDTALTEAIRILDNRARKLNEHLGIPDA